MEVDARVLTLETHRRSTLNKGRKDALNNDLEVICSCHAQDAAILPSPHYL